MKRKRLFIVSSRLPICISGERDKTTVTPESSDFATAVNQFLDKYKHTFPDLFWTGIPGCTPSTWNEATNHLEQSRFTYIPVLVYKEQYKYYHKFSGSTLLTLFSSSGGVTMSSEEEYQHYLQVNEHFAEILSRHCRKDDTVWIDGYHLLFLPDMLRRKIPGLTIGAFLQFPFPSYERFDEVPRTLQLAMLNGITAANFIGFRSDADSNNFLECVSQKFDASIRDNEIIISERAVQILSLPVNSDFNSLEIAAGLSARKVERALNS